MNKLISRFASPSYGLVLKHLHKEARVVLGVSLCVALLAHLSLGALRSRGEVKNVPKPLTTQFVKREPRLTRPLELRKRPQPRKRAVQRQMVTVKARTVTAGSGLAPVSTVGLAGRLAQPRVFVSRLTALQGGNPDPLTLAATIQSSSESENRVDLALGLVDVDALDTGQYHAMVIQDANDKRNVKGYFHFIQAYPVSVVAERGQMNEYPRALRNLVEQLSVLTGIRADVRRSIPFSSEEIFRVPFIYFDYGTQGYTARLTAAEAERLGQYMMLGGLYMAEDGWPALGSAMDKAARATIEDALAAVGMPKGAAWDFEKIPNDHAIYHVYYDLEGGPPIGADSVRHPAEGIPGPFPWLEGVFRDTRLIAIMSNKAYQDVWSLRKDVPVITAARPRAFQMGINIIIFALTQEGSITKRVMDTVQY